MELKGIAMSKPTLGKQRVYQGAFSSDDKEAAAGVGLDRDSYYPSRKPNKYVKDDGKSPIQLDTDNVDSGSEWPKNSRAKGGFSGRIDQSWKK
jgi:hypothetical protein